MQGQGRHKYIPTRFIFDVKSEHILGYTGQTLKHSSRDGKRILCISN
jgi:hypothetical protein